MVGVIIEAVFLAACQVETELFLVAVLVPLVAWLFCLLYDYYRKNSFYRRLFQNLDRMDQKYLVLETLESPRFYDGELLKEALYEANKSMTEHVNESRRVMREFKDFIEMWVHQVKLPVASLLLLCHNHPDENNKKYMEQLRRIDRYTEQVLYYTRAEHAKTAPPYTGLYTGAQARRLANTQARIATTKNTMPAMRVTLASI